MEKYLNLIMGLICGIVLTLLNNEFVLYYLLKEGEIINKNL